jgi:chaperonin GroES
MVYYIAGSHSQAMSAKNGSVSPPSKNSLLTRIHIPNNREDRVMTTVSVGLRPLGDRLVVKALAREAVTKSGIVLPDTATEKPQEGEVLAVGSGKVLENGKRSILEVQVGQRVLFAKYAGTEVKVEGQEYLILRESDIVAIVE